MEGELEGFYYNSGYVYFNYFKAYKKIEQRGLLSLYTIINSSLKWVLNLFLKGVVVVRRYNRLHETTGIGEIPLWIG